MPATNPGINQIAINVNMEDLNGSQKKGNCLTPYKPKNSGIPSFNEFNCRYIAMAYPPKEKKIPCPKLSNPVKPQLKSIPNATIPNDKHFPNIFNLESLTKEGIAINKAKAIAQISKDNCFFDIVMTLPFFLFEGITLKV